MNRALEVVDASVHPVDVALREPFGIATGVQTQALNAFVQVTLAGGQTGVGEAAPFPAVTGETRAQVLAALPPVLTALRGRNAAHWMDLYRDLAPALTHNPSALCAVETALLDALCRAQGRSVFQAMGGAQPTLVTDMTITTGTAQHAALAAQRLAVDGYLVIKLKVGGVAFEADAERLVAVSRAAPSCGLLLDGNAALEGAQHALALLACARELGARVVLLEQPLPRDDHAGQALLCAQAGVPVAADESATTVADVRQLAAERRAHVVNLKITKSGVRGFLEMAQVARQLGLDLMVGGMVETRVAMATSAHLAAGLGGFVYVDLDTPAWLHNSPAHGGYNQQGPRLHVAGHGPGHGVRIDGFAHLPRVG